MVRGMVSKTSGNPRGDGRLDAEDWILGALGLWAERGLDGVTIAALSERLGVTKGSFYWHFENREALVRRALALWAERSTKDTIAALSSIAEPRRRLLALFETAFDELDHLRMEAAILAAGLAGNDEVRGFYEKVHAVRVRFVSRIYAELGLDRRRARTRAVATMGTYLGTLQLALLRARGLRTRSELAALRCDVEALFVPSPETGRSADRERSSRRAARARP